MDVRSQPSPISSNDSFSIPLHKGPPPVQPPQPVPNMRLTFSSDGTNIYKQVPATSPSPSPSPFHGSSTAVAAGDGGNAADGGPPVQTTVASSHYLAAPPIQTIAAPSHYHAAPPVQTIAASTHYHGANMNIGERIKRKRGRPRKYGPDGTMAPVRMRPTAAMGAPVSSGFPSPVGQPNATTSSAPSDGAMKKKGRPPGSVNKPKLSALGSSGTAFTPHVITIKAGEDVSSKIMSFLHHGPSAICVLSANGAISNVTLSQAATSGGTVTYEGRFEILSLSGSFFPSDIAGQRSRTGGLSISLAGSDGRVLGGGVAGLLTAASPIQVVLGSFKPNGKKKYKEPSVSNPAPIKMFSPLGNAGPSSPPSHETPSESSGGGGGGPPDQNPVGDDSSSLADLAIMPWK